MIPAGYFLALAALAAPLSAQDIQVTASVSTNTAGAQDQFQLTVTVSGADFGDIAPPRLPRLRGFQVVAGPSTSTQFQWINGRSSQSKSFIYILLPEREGQYRIDSIEVAVGDKVYRTEPIDVRVTARSPGPATRMPSFQDPFSETAPDTQQGRPTGDEVFVRAELDRLSAYVGQQVTLSYYLYTQVSVTGLQLQENPPLTGFWVEDLQVDGSPTGERKVVNGREYLAYLVKQQALFPNTAGRLSVPSATFAISAKSVGNFLGLFGQTETLYRKTPEATLEVKPLPLQDRPADFTDAVGSFRLASGINRNEVATGEAVTLQVKLAGEGNLKIIPDFKLPPLPDFTVYASKSTENAAPDPRRQVGGERTWEFVLIPKVPGPHTLPALAFSFFDPARSRYETVTTAPLELKVVRGSGEAGGFGATEGTGKTELRRQGTDINYIKLSARALGPAPAPPYRKAWFFLIAAAPLVLNAGLLLYRRERSRQSANLSLARSRRAASVALRRLKQAVREGRKEPKRFYDGAAVAFAGYMEDKFDLPGIAVTGDMLERTLSERGVPPDSVGEVKGCLEACDFGRFVSASPLPATMAALAQRIREAIRTLERHSG